MLYSDQPKKRIADVSMRFRCDWEVALCESSHKLHFKVTDSEFDEFYSRLNDLNITCVTICCLDMPTTEPCSLGMDSVAISFPLASMFLIAGIWLTGFARERMRGTETDAGRKT